MGAYWGCCRGCGAHLIWVTTIDAFEGKKLSKTGSPAIYFTVLHNWLRFSTKSGQFCDFSGRICEKKRPSSDPNSAAKSPQSSAESSPVPASHGRIIFSRYSIGNAP